MMPIPFRYALIGLSALLLLVACDSPKQAAKPPVRISAEAKKIVQEKLASITSPVTLLLYRGGENERQGEETQVLVDFIKETSTKVTVVTGELDDEAKADLEVNHGPVVEMKSPVGGVMRYYGFPERKEVRPFLEGILLASGGAVKLSPDVRSFLAGLEQDVVIRIFTTPD